MIHITGRQFDAAISRAYNSEMKKTGNSWSKATISNHAGSAILEIRDDGKQLVVKDNWRDIIKTIATKQR